MQRAISYQGFLPIRSEPSHMAGMISQLLFAESCTILSSEGSWMLLESDSEQKTAWVTRNALTLLNEDEWREKQEQTGELMAILPFVKVKDEQHARQFLIPAGSVLGNDKRFKKISDEGWIAPGTQLDPEEVGKGLLSIPALQGGRCGFGFDAPGLVQLLCRSMGISVPHSISAQAEYGSITNFIHEAQKGDLAFFHNGEDHFTHVGMVLDDGKIIHASDQVRIDRLDQQGIYCDEKERYTHQLRVVKSRNS